MPESISKIAVKNYLRRYDTRLTIAGYHLNQLRCPAVTLKRLIAYINVFVFLVLGRKSMCHYCALVTVIFFIKTRLSGGISAADQIAVDAFHFAGLRQPRAEKKYNLPKSQTKLT